jgi:hypothetical protein
LPNHRFIRQPLHHRSGEIENQQRDCDADQESQRVIFLPKKKNCLTPMNSSDSSSRRM